jgi:serine/threonine protein kinase
LTPLTQIDIQSEHEKLKAFCNQRTHKNLVSIHRHGCLKVFGTEDQLPFYYIDMELGEQSLSNYIANRYSGGTDDGISNREVWSIVQQLASGTKYLHGKDIFGACLKPDNSTYTIYFALF